MEKNGVFRTDEIEVLKYLLYGAAISVTDVKGYFRGPRLVEIVHERILSGDDRSGHVALDDYSMDVIKKYRRNPETLKKHLTTALMYLSRDDMIVSRDERTPEDLIALYEDGFEGVSIGLELIPDQSYIGGMDRIDVGMGQSNLRN